MVSECINGLNIREDGVYLDGTAGGGGHAAEIAKRLTTGRLYCIDRDPDAVKATAKRLSGFANVEVIEGNFKDARELLGEEINGLDGALLDLGVSSRQLDDAGRGFSYLNDGPLDMRMSQCGVSAADIVNEYEERQITEILYRYGEERFAPAISRKIVAARQTMEINSTSNLAEIVASALPPAVRRRQKNPARRTFMALRIATNREWEAIDEGLKEIFDLLKGGGRFCVITFHSLEDRLVKRFFAKLSTACDCPPDFPVCVCGGKAQAKLVTKKALTPCEREIVDNRRSRSAKLRIAEKTA